MMMTYHTNAPSSLSVRQYWSCWRPPYRWYAAAAAVSVPGRSVHSVAAAPLQFSFNETVNEMFLKIKNRSVHSVAAAPLKFNFYYTGN
jgi:hypothetical protein